MRRQPEHAVTPARCALCGAATNDPVTRTCCSVSNCRCRTTRRVRWLPDTWAGVRAQVAVRVDHRSRVLDVEDDWPQDITNGQGAGQSPSDRTDLLVKLDGQGSSGFRQVVSSPLGARVMPSTVGGLMTASDASVR
jgi:hypothetical protein